MNTPPEVFEHDPDLDLDDEVRRLLNLHRGQWVHIPVEIGVSYSWLSKFARGKITNPGYWTLKRLHLFLSEWQQPEAESAPPPLRSMPPPVATEPA